MSCGGLNKELDAAAKIERNLVRKAGFKRSIFFPISHNHENVRRRSSKIIKKTRKQLGHKNLAPIPSKFLPPFPSSPDATREGSVGATTRVPHHRVSAKAMADRRKRGAPVGSMSSPRPRQRFRTCTRQDTLKKRRAVAAVLMVLSVVTATVVQRFVLVNLNLRALSMYILVVLLVSAALRSVLVTNSRAPT